MITSIVLQIIIFGGFAYLAYLLLEFRDRAIGTTKRKDPLFKDVPGWPLIGQLVQGLADSSNHLEASTRMALKLRPGYSTTVPGVRMIDVSKPEWLEYIQKTNFDNYEKGPLYRELMGDLFGNGIIVLDGAQWKRARTVNSRVFHTQTFKTVIEPSVDQSLDGLLKVLQSASDESRGVDFCNLFTRFTLASFVKMTFGRALGIYGEQSTAEAEAQASNKHLCSPEVFAEALDFSQKQIDFRFNVMTGWELYEKIIPSVGQRMKRSCDTIHNYAYTLIDERMSKLSSDGDSTNGNDFQNDFLGLMMDFHRQQGHTMDREELKDATFGFLLAGRDATAQSLSWCLFHLLMNKDMISKIREEVAQLLGTNPSDESRVTYENYKQFTITYAAILEAVRLHPPVPKSLKFAKTDDVIPGGPTVEAGDCVIWSDWQMARDPETWGSDCGQFKPDRWIDEDGKIRNFGNFIYHAFNGGPRRCVGMTMAIFVMVKTIVEMLQKYDLEFSEGWLENVPKSADIEGIRTNYPTPQYLASMTLPMKNPMMVAVKPRLNQDK
ncbi:hypothetical protein PTTG_28169 [Puccinia triticina 1-1 BBBD Race 1]|uniref:Cytochrome P450 n=1 Tax=Puccinia triticina (isolate 1-1 / race 1 (BBBD)) TaxID=630390 RepID=A0A180GDV3_PUCT1|nr:hypothetical protein PTTG_28169 [Puccinia triticina 1-1 BBBD Race 1]